MNIEDFKKESVSPIRMFSEIVLTISEIPKIAQKLFKFGAFQKNYVFLGISDF
ncbi:MAG: hypothetical protein ACE5HW_04215 [Candidatus Methanofastidiosia archaeon]